MKRQILLFLFVLVAFNLILTAQNPISNNTKQQEKNLKRWIWHQPSAKVVLKAGDTLVGQPIHFNMEELMIYPSDTLPLGLKGRLKVIPFAEIDRILLSKGGRITAAQTSGIIVGIAGGTGLGLLIGGPVGGLIGGNILGVTGGLTGRALHKRATNEEIWLNPSSLDYRSDLIKLRTWSVFEDSVFYTEELEKLPEHSAAVRRAFPQKQFRISLGLNTGIGIFLEGNLRDAVESSGLPEWNESYGSTWGFEFLDFSWRVNPHWVAGGGLMKAWNDLFYISYYPNYSETEVNINYSYWMTLTDVRLYTEYVLNPVNRFFTTRSELLFGGGPIISLPETSYGYSEADPSTDFQESANLQKRHTVFGLQLRGAYHFYLARNFSLSGGLEVNLYQTLKLAGLEPPDGYAGEHFGFRDHTLNYSTVRVKFGANLYF